eukprot:GSChrysophyteH1.ASY1.ANO1.1982.1 assembled CDS
MLAVFLGLIFTGTTGECPGACSGHGVCGSYDSCVCYKGYMGGDCSQRVCQFGLAHVDIPKGDLDASDEITDYNTRIAVYSHLYPTGTTEQYPNMRTSRFSILSNTAHEYVECSNKGDCDRKEGVCECIPGYEGSACQRASCPGEDDEPACSGHGVCLTAREVAAADHGNVYALWDADVSMGCECDKGYTGPSCEKRTCKHGYDPMFQDPEGSHRYTNTSYVIYVRNNDAVISGNYSILFHDVYGETWQTRPIDYDASCFEVIDALESIPNDVIPFGSPIHFPAGSDYNGIKYTLAFPGNPGELKPLQILKYLDGQRPTLFSSEPKSTLNVFVYPNGFTGESTEYWVEKCIGVELSLRHQEGIMDGLDYLSEYSYIADLTLLEMRLLQRCLGDADGSVYSKSATGRIEGADYDWDYGSIYNPHIVRLVEVTNPDYVVTDLCDRGRTCTYKNPNPGFYAALYFDTTLGTFRLMNRPAIDYSPTTMFAVWTTKGHAQMVSDEVDIYTEENRDHMYLNTVFTTNSTGNFSGVGSQYGYTGQLSCEINKESQHGAFTCLEKEDRVFFLDTDRPERNPQYLNIYTVKRLHVEHRGTEPTQLYQDPRNRIELNAAINSNFHDPNGTFSVRAYKFYPPDGVKYVDECSNRGICDAATGLCSCFEQYSNDDCSQLSIYSPTGSAA